MHTMTVSMWGSCGITVTGADFCHQVTQLATEPPLPLQHGTQALSSRSHRSHNQSGSVRDPRIKVARWVHVTAHVGLGQMLFVLEQGKLNSLWDVSWGRQWGLSFKGGGGTYDLRESWLCESGTGNPVTWLPELLGHEPAAGAEASHLAFVEQLLSC